MADVAHETKPPGSWPKGKPTDEASDAAPRSAPAVGKDEHSTTGDHQNDEQSESNYTHHKDDDKTEEANGGDEEQQNGLKQVEAEPISDEADKTANDEKIQEEAKKAKLPKSSLNAKNAMAAVAKKAFDKASKKDNAADATAEPEKAETTEAPVDDKTLTDDKISAGDKTPAADTNAEDASKVKDVEGDKLDTDTPKVEAEQEKAGDLTKEGDKAEDLTKEGDKAEDLTKEGVKAEDLTKEGDKAEDLTKEDDKAEDLTKEGDKTEALAQEGEDTQKVLGEGDKPEDAAQEATEEATEEADKVDLSVLKNAKVNKGGNLVDSDNKVVGRVKEGVVANLIGKRADENGNIWDNSGKVVGKAELIPDDEKDALLKEPAPFEAFPDAVVDGKGMVVSGGETIGKVVDGDIKTLRGKSVDPDGDILDRGGNVVGKAERWEPEPEAEPEPEQEVDRSILAGKRVNKAGNVVDSGGNIFGRVIEGNAKSMVGRMCDKKGNILSESGDVIGKAEVVPEGEREGLKEGPFAELSGCTVTKDGKVVTPGGDVVGRLISGDPKKLFGRSVDEDGDVCDKNGNTLGKAERWEEPEVEKKKGPMAGRRVNREGNVVDEDGNLIGKLTTGELSICAGKEIDDDGDVVDSKGTTIGHVSLIQDIPEPEPEPTESAEEKESRESIEKDRKLAAQMAGCLEQCLDKIKPICNMISEKIDRAERTPKEELDEEELVKQVRPLLEEGGKILNEANGIIRGLDPDGRIQANAKHKTATREATPEEFHLADVLKELTGTVTKTIEDGKKKIESMPHAKKELNPLWGLLNEPLFQILAAVGLLLNGVLSLVGRLLSGLGLGGLLDGLLGTLGLNRVLEGLGLGSVTKSLTGGGKKKSGGLLGLGG